MKCTLYKEVTMSTIFADTDTKMYRVYNFMRSGHRITPTQARTRFGVKNLRATISDINETLADSGSSYTVIREESNSGSSAYRLMRSR